MCMWVELPDMCMWVELPDMCMCMELPDRWVELPNNSCHGDLTHGRGALALTYAKMMHTAIHDCGTGWSYV